MPSYLANVIVFFGVAFTLLGLSSVLFPIPVARALRERNIPLRPSMETTPSNVRSVGAIFLGLGLLMILGWLVALLGVGLEISS